MAAANRYFGTLDALRGIAALCVFMVHAQIEFAGQGLEFFYRDSVFVKHSYLFVDFFFVLSGFVITASYGDRLRGWGELRAFMILRFARLYPIHLVVLLAFVAFEGIKALLAGLSPGVVRTEAFTGRFAVEFLPANVLLVHGFGFDDEPTWNRPSWSISTEFWTYLLFGVLAAIGFTRWRLFVPVALGAVLGMAVGLAAQHVDLDITGRYAWVRCIMGFFVGVLVYRLHRRLAKRGLLGTLADRTGTSLLEVAAVLALVVFVLAAYGAVSFLAPAVFAAVVFLFAGAQGVVSSFLNLPLLRWLGTISYSIYMVHYLVLIAVGLVVRRVSALQSALAVDLVTIGAGILVCLVATLTYRWVEKPWRDRSRRAVGAVRTANAPPA